MHHSRPHYCGRSRGLTFGVGAGILRVFAAGSRPLVWRRYNSPAYGFAALDLRAERPRLAIPGKTTYPN